MFNIEAVMIIQETTTDKTLFFKTRDFHEL